jgi:hypothetical protein
MLQLDFVEGLKWLGRQRLAFDLGVDARQGGLGQLREAAELIKRANDGVSQEDRIVVIISKSFNLPTTNRILTKKIIYVNQTSTYCRTKPMIIPISLNGKT